MSLAIATHTVAINANPDTLCGRAMLDGSLVQ